MYFIWLLQSLAYISHVHFCPRKKSRKWEIHLSGLFVKVFLACLWKKENDKASLHQYWLPVTVTVSYTVQYSPN
jgi:hypothetical protein